MSEFDVKSSIPCAITSGEAESWTETLPDYPDPTYGVYYYFAGNTPVDGFQKFSIQGSGSGTSFTFTFPSGNDSPKPGKYKFQKVAVRASDSQRRDIGCGGWITIKPNLDTTPTTTAAQTRASNLETVIASLSSKKNQSVSFNGQSYTQKDLSRLRDDLVAAQAEVLREQNALNALTGSHKDRNITVYFE